MKIYLDTNLEKEVEYFQKKYSFKIVFFADKSLLIPEYKIELMNKSKKVISTFENLNKIKELNIKFQKSLKSLALVIKTN